MKNNYFKFFLGIIMGILVTILPVSAAVVYQASQIGYNDQNSRLGASDVQNSIDNLAKKTKDSDNYNVLHIYIYYTDEEGTQKRIIQPFYYPYQNVSGHDITWGKFIYGYYEWSEQLSEKIYFDSYDEENVYVYLEDLPPENNTCMLENVTLTDIVNNGPYITYCNNK